MTLLLLLALACKGTDTADTVVDTDGDTDTDTDATDTDTGGTTERSLADADVAVAGTGGSALGTAVASAGDADGDGKGDVLVGGSTTGIVCLVAGVTPGSLTTSSLPCWTQVASADFAGYALSSGDLDGDGAVDLVAGAIGADAGGTDRGTVYVFAPGAGGSLGDAWAQWSGKADLDAAGTSVDVGDVTGDGVADLLVGAPGNDDGGSSGGEVYVVPGPLKAGSFSFSSAPTSIQGAGGPFRHGGGGTGDLLGNSVVDAGDLDGDGVDDLAASAGGSSAAGIPAGMTVILYGPVPSGHFGFGSVDVWLLGDAATSYTGEPTAGVGDVDGDGRDDVTVSANGVSHAEIYLFPGGFSLGAHVVSDAATTIVGEHDNDGAGWAVDGGDTDGDGVSDLLIGAPWNDGAGVDAGAAYVVRGAVPTGTLTLSDADVVLRGIAASDGAGKALASAGDVDGDGLVDLVVGAPFAAYGDGAAYVAFGSSL